LAEPCAFRDACLGHLSAQPGFSESFAQFFAKTPRHLLCLGTKRGRTFFLRTSGQVSFPIRCVATAYHAGRTMSKENRIDRPNVTAASSPRAPVSCCAGSPCRRRIEVAEFAFVARQRERCHVAPSTAPGTADWHCARWSRSRLIRRRSDRPKWFRLSTYWGAPHSADQSRPSVFCNVTTRHAGGRHAPVSGWRPSSMLDDRSCRVVVGPPGSSISQRDGLLFQPGWEVLREVGLRRSLMLTCGRQHRRHPRRRGRGVKSSPDGHVWTAYAVTVKRRLIPARLLEKFCTDRYGIGQPTHTRGSRLFLRLPNDRARPFACALCRSSEATASPSRTRRATPLFDSC
jgi:hypothetical protein